jgi:hypothetical protein
MADLGGGEWVTMNGRHVFIAEGSTLNEALALKFEPSDNVKRAIASKVLTDKKVQDVADKSEEVLSRAIGIPRTRDNSAFDLRNDDVGIECKCFTTNTRDRVSMTKTAVGRKLAEASADEIKMYTVVVDRRAGWKAGNAMGSHATYYYRQGVGEFHLGTMTKVSLPELRAIVRGK